MHTLTGIYVDFSQAVGISLPAVYIPRGYVIEKQPPMYNKFETFFPFTMRRLFDSTAVGFTFHIPMQQGMPYWTVDSNTRRTHIKAHSTDKVINKIKLDMTKQRKAKQGHGYYL